MLKEIEGFKLSAQGKKLFYEVSKIDKDLDTEELVCTKTDGKTKYDFNLFMTLLKFTEKVYTGELTSQEAKDDQAQLEILIMRLDKEYNPKIKRKMDEKKEVLKSAEKLFYVRENIISGFEKGVFLYKNKKEESEEESKQTEEKPNKMQKPSWVNISDDNYNSLI